MATVANLYGETPQVPTMPIRATMPLPAGHTLDLSDPDVSPFTIKSNTTDLDTSCIPIMWDKNGLARKVLLTAIGTQAQADEATLIVTDDESSTGSFTVDAAVNTLASTTGFPVTVTTPDGDYSGTIVAELLKATIHKTHATVPFYVRLVKGTNGLLDDFGSLKGFMTVYSGIDLIDLDFLWTMSEIEDPRGRCFFNKVTMGIPDGFQVKSRIKDAYWGSGPEASGVTEVDLIPAVSSPPAGTSAHHTFLPLAAKQFRLTVFKETVADTMPTWADDWIDNPGWFFVSSNTARTDLAGGYHGQSLSTPATFSGVPMPEMDETNIGNAIDTTMTTFLSEFAAGTNTEWFGSDSTDSSTSWRSRVGNRGGDATGGDKIEPYIANRYANCGRLEFPSFVLNICSGLVDRQPSFMDYGPLPFDYDRWKMDFPDDKLQYGMGPSGIGSGPANQAFGTSDETGWRFDGVSNWSPSAIAQDQAETQKWGPIDGNHFIRYSAWFIGAVEFLHTPFDLLMLRYAASMAIMDSPEPLENYYRYGSGKGAEIGRAAGWIAYTLGATYAHIPPRFRTKGLGKTIKRWGEDFAEVLSSCQMPNGGFIAWGPVGNNKEYKAARRDTFGLALKNEAEAQGFDPPGGGAWGDYDYNGTSGFSDLEDLFSNEALDQIEAATTVPMVAQPYQEAILHLGAHAIDEAIGLGLEDEVLFSLVATLLIYRFADAGETPGTDDFEPWYLVGVYPVGKPKQVSMTAAQVEALYYSGQAGSTYEGGGNERSGFNYKHSLGLAARITFANPFAKALALAIATIYDSDYETTADDSESLLRNGEALLAIQQLTA